MGARGSLPTYKSTLLVSQMLYVVPVKHTCNSNQWVTHMYTPVTERWTAVGTYGNPTEHLSANMKTWIYHCCEKQ